MLFAAPKTENAASMGVNTLPKANATTVSAAAAALTLTVKPPDIATSVDELPLFRSMKLSPTTKFVVPREIISPATSKLPAIATLLPNETGTPIESESVVPIVRFTPLASRSTRLFV